jgi:hypothetical protein
MVTGSGVTPGRPNIQDAQNLRIGAALILTSLIVCGGCAGRSSTTATNPDYLEQYTSGRYRESYRSASREADASRGMRREHAGLTAGLSAYAMDRHAEAEHWLRPLVDSTDAGISGQAAATLGLIAQKRGEHARAAELLSFASGRLSGPDSARAALYACDSYRALGRHADADRHLAHARAEAGGHAEIARLIAQRRPAAVPSATGVSPAAVPAPGSLYTISLGAFSQFERARRVADEAQPRALALGLGPPRVVAVTARTGATLYSVRVGRFQSRTEAERHRGSFGPEAAVALTTSE